MWYLVRTASKPSRRRAAGNWTDENAAGAAPTSVATRPAASPTPIDEEGDDGVARCVCVKAAQMLRCANVLRDRVCACVSYGQAAEEETRG